MHSHDLISVSVGEIRPNGQGNLSIILQTAAGEILPAYSAGAHIDIIIPGVGPRQYSLCGTPDRSNTYEICVRLTDTSTGGSRYLHQQLKAGDRLAISPPRNHFPLPQAGRYLLFAGGIGITPLLAMAEAIAARKGALELRYQGGAQLSIRGPAGETTRLPRCSEWPPCRSQSAGSGAGRRRSGANWRHNNVVIACGPEGFIQRLRSVMEEYRWSPSQFVFERFTPAAENNTAAKNAFYIELASSGQRLQVAADQTIAQVLQHAGVEVMLSCEQGMCGSCITGVLDGIPEHRDSVLTAEEKAGNDQITLCCSRAKSPGLVLDL